MAGWRKVIRRTTSSVGLADDKLCKAKITELDEAFIVQVFGDAEDLLLFGKLANVRVRSALYGAVFVSVQHGEVGLWGVLQREYADRAMSADAPDER